MYSELEAIVDKLAKETENMVNQTKLVGVSVVTSQLNQTWQCGQSLVNQIKLDSVVTGQPNKIWQRGHFSTKPNFLQVAI